MADFHLVHMHAMQSTRANASLDWLKTCLPFVLESSPAEDSSSGVVQPPRSSLYPIVLNSAVRAEYGASTRAGGAGRSDILRSIRLLGPAGLVEVPPDPAQAFLRIRWHAASRDGTASPIHSPGALLRSSKLEALSLLQASISMSATRRRQMRGTWCR